MKRILYVPLVLAPLFLLAQACNKVSYKKTPSGLLYKIVSNGKDSLVKEGQWLKLHFQQTITRANGKDSVLQSSYGKMPVYTQVNNSPQNTYNPGEIFPMLRKGDSVVTVVLTDSLLKKGQLQELPPFMKKGDKITTGFKVLDIFSDEAKYNEDRQKEAERDRPRMMKEREEEQSKMEKKLIEEQEKEVAGHEKSGEAAKQNAAMEAYLAGKNIKAQKINPGIYLVMEREGTGAHVTKGKFATVKYEGISLRTDSTFDSGEFTRPIGVAGLIYGMDKGLQSFKVGGKGVLYIPGYLAYGDNPQPGSPFKAFESMKFNIEITNLTDTMPRQEMPMQQPR